MVSWTDHHGCIHSTAEDVQEQEVPSPAVDGRWGIFCQTWRAASFSAWCTCVGIVLTCSRTVAAADYTGSSCCADVFVQVFLVRFKFSMCYVRGGEYWWRHILRCGSRAGCFNCCCTDLWGWSRTTGMCSCMKDWRPLPYEAKYRWQLQHAVLQTEIRCVLITAATESYNYALYTCHSIISNHRTSLHMYK